MHVNTPVPPAGNSIASWIIDFGASHHMTSNACILVHAYHHLFITFLLLMAHLPITKIGNITYASSSGLLFMLSTLLVPNLMLIYHLLVKLLKLVI